MVIGGFILLGVGIQLYWIEASRSPGAAGDGIDLLQNLLPLVFTLFCFPRFPGCRFLFDCAVVPEK